MDDLFQAHRALLDGTQPACTGRSVRSVIRAVPRGHGAAVPQAGRFRLVYVRRPVAV